MRDTAWPTSPAATSSALSGAFLFPLPRRREQKGDPIFGSTCSLLKGNTDSSRHHSLCMPGCGDWPMAKASLLWDFSFSVLSVYLVQWKKKKHHCPCYSTSPWNAAKTEAQNCKTQLALSWPSPVLPSFLWTLPLEKWRGKCSSGRNGSHLHQHQLSRKLDLWGILICPIDSNDTELEISENTVKKKSRT